MKLDCVRCNKCGKVHSVEKGCDLPEAEASAEAHKLSYMKYGGITLKIKKR